MDILKIKTNFMRSILSKVVASMIYKKFGYKVKIKLNEIDVAVTNGNAHIKLNVEGDMNVDELKRLQN